MNKLNNNDLKMIIAILTIGVLIGVFGAITYINTTTTIYKDGQFNKQYTGQDYYIICTNEDCSSTK